MIVQAIVLVGHFPISYLFIFTLDMKVIGAGIAFTITFTLSCLLLTAYIYLLKNPIPQESLHWFNKDSFKNWSMYLRLGIPSAGMLCLEWFCFEIIALFVGNLGVIELAAYIAMWNFL